MKKSLFLFVLSVVLFSCKSKSAITTFNELKSLASIDTLFNDKISIRAIEIDKNKVWYAADKNRYGYYDLDSNKRVERKISSDSLKLEFRSIAQTKNSIFMTIKCFDTRTVVHVPHFDRFLFRSENYFIVRQYPHTDISFRLNSF